MEITLRLSDLLIQDQTLLLLVKICLVGLIVVSIAITAAIVFMFVQAYRDGGMP